ncbi:homoserine kinase [Aristolochia californica]|uniref:homoserine kinase n=1 Tax=Aristolochia californica TaxID=171875 RepID=UPI0035D83A2D
MALCNHSSLKASPVYFPRISPHQPSFSLPRLPCVVRCCSISQPLKTLAIDPSPVVESLTTFAPATVANLGPAFDILGCAVDGIGDKITLRVDPDVTPGHITISNISGAGKKLSLNPFYNCAGIAAISVIKMLGVRSVGLSMSLEKGLPLGSGLGSSAASAAAAAVAVNEIFGRKLSEADLILAGLESEAKVSGYHADNIAPAIAGGFVLVRSYNPLELIPLKFPADKNLFFVLVSPEFEAPTKKMRAVLPTEVSMKDLAANCSQVAALVKAVIEGDVKLLGSAMSLDVVVEPRRIVLIPGMAAVKRAALEAGAFGCTISGAGPTAVAVTDDEGAGLEIGAHMVEAFWKEGNLKATATVRRLDREGARVCSTGSN